MSNIWDKIYSDASAFFGEDPSDFAQKCYNYFKKYGVKRTLELGCGQGRDTIFFASNGIDVEALDYSVIAVDILDKIRKEKSLPIKPGIFDAKSPFAIQDSFFDAVYSHMLLNMRFSLKQLHFIFSEIKRAYYIFRLEVIRMFCITKGKKLITIFMK
ncbi:MAG: methyltransferase domain-containing protein [Thaumarchaeota archaeon]|nr:MAG: methyltransferase domain-containing protein [Nitrososphaerota archaeon]